MNTNKNTKANTSFSLDDLQDLAEAQAAPAGAEVSEAELLGDEAAEVVSADHRQLRALAKSGDFKAVEVDHTIFETQKLNEGAKIRYTSTFDDVTLFNALNSSSESIADHFDEDIKVLNMVLTTAQVSSDFNDDFAEKEDKPCVHFFCEDGLHLASVSNGIIRSTENLIACGFMPTPEAPIIIRFKPIKTKRGTAHTFDLVSR